jgi:type II secretory pathway component GspD/PulD (secretin)
MRHCTEILPRTSVLARTLIVLVAGLIVGAPALAQALEIIELRYRLADDVIPVIQPLVEPGGALTGSDNKLFLRASPANIAEIRRVLAAIDHAPRQLLITVGQGTARGSETTNVRGGVTIGDGDMQVDVNRPAGVPSGAEVQGNSASRQVGIRNVSSVQTLEGSETLIAAGNSVPITTRSVSPGWSGPVVQESTTYRAVATGFYATPRITGDRVVLEISPRQERYRAATGTYGGGIIETSSATTIVSGRLGEWIELGAVRESGTGSTGGILVWSRHTESSEYSAWVKVEEIPTPP